jgi:DNA-binding MarR family transcriptional regulator
MMGLAMAEPELFSALVKKLTHVFAGEFDRRLRRHGVTLAQWGILRHLWAQEGRSQVELQSLLTLEAATITGLLQRMERDGLVYRQVDPADKRMQRVFLTADGRALEPLVRDIAEDINALALRDFTDAEQQMAQQLLARALHNLSAK